MLKIDLSDIARFSARMKRLDLRYGDIKPLLENWERLMEEGNRKGILASQDKDGNPAPALKYRPKGGVLKLTVGQRLGQRANLRRGKYAGKGSYNTHGQHGLLANNNLSNSQYRHLDGPRDAPRRQFSRVITNALTGHGRDPTTPDAWFVDLAWGEIASPIGFHFLPALCTGTKSIPPYDIRGVRPKDIDMMRASLRKWCKLTIRGEAFRERLG